MSARRDANHAPRRAPLLTPEAAAALLGRRLRDQAVKRVPGPARCGVCGTVRPAGELVQDRGRVRCRDAGECRA